jgi:hypothetical protein
MLDKIQKACDGVLGVNNSRVSASIDSDAYIIEVKDHRAMLVFDGDKIRRFSSSDLSYAIYREYETSRVHLIEEAKKLNFGNYSRLAIERPTLQAPAMKGIQNHETHWWVNQKEQAAKIVQMELQETANIVGDIIRDIDGDKANRIKEATSTELSLDEVGRLYRRFREKGGLEEFCKKLMRG